MSDLLFPFLRDMVPVVLALYALWRCAGALVRRTTRRERAVMMLGCVCSIMLIVAQLSWWAAKWDGRAEDGCPAQGRGAGVGVARVPGPALGGGVARQGQMGLDSVSHGLTVARPAQ